jgi:hypothetical protein
MANDKLKSLTKYQTKIQERLSSATPDKHKHRETSYREFLQRELDTTSKKIAELKLIGAK